MNLPETDARRFRILQIRIALTDAGREVVDLARPTSALRSTQLGHGAHLTLTTAPAAAKRQALVAAARELVRAVLDDGPTGPGDVSPGPDAHLSGRGGVV